MLATPLMILAMENAALNAIRDYLEPGESAVGTVVDIRHLAATPVGQRVTAETEVTLVEDPRIVFAVTARDEIEEIGRGIHERMVVELRRIAKRLDAKKQAAIKRVSPLRVNSGLQRPARPMPALGQQEILNMKEIE